MNEVNLFRDNTNTWVTNLDILKTLEKVGADKANILYIHTGISFGMPNPEIPKNEILQILLDTILELRVPTICVPTFTFSFCNGRAFDITNSKSKMGALNEYIRKQPAAIRSIDPLMSVALLGGDKDLATGIGHFSIGKDSTFDKLHDRKGVKFLFFGTQIGDCFTYMHYMEYALKVSYRYDRIFSGEITTPSGTYNDNYTLFVRYSNIIPGDGSYIYGDLLINSGKAKKELCGDNSIISVEEPAAFEIYAGLLKKDPSYFLAPSSIYDYDKTFIAKDMVAL
jgi:aminoglycoside 3-N-acetyltransferase